MSNIVSKDTYSTSTVEKLDCTSTDSESELEWEEGDSITYCSKDKDVMNYSLEKRQNSKDILLQEDQSSVLPNTNCLDLTQKISNCGNKL